MARSKQESSTRQLYASIREDLYLAAKARATKLRVPLREFLERALELALTDDVHAATTRAAPSVWDDEYLGMQARQEVGSPVELTREEAEKVVRGSFGVQEPESGDSAEPATGSEKSLKTGEGRDG